MSNSAIPWTAADQTSLSFTLPQSLLKLMFIDSMMPSNHLILYHPILLLPSIFPSIRVFSNKLALCSRWPEYGTFINTFTLNKLLPWKCLAQSENIKVGVFPPSLSAHHNEPSALHRQRSCKSTPQGPLCISHKEFVCQQGRCLPKDRVLPGRSTAIRGLSEG